MEHKNNSNNNQTLPLHKLEQFIANVKVLEELAKPNPKPETLKKYKGFGGLRNCFWDKQLYGQIMRAIRANFGAAQEKNVLENLRQSTKSAYYTPKEVISFMYRYLEQVCNFTGGEILEPSCGNGAFFEHMPESIRHNSQITGVEYDILTSKLVKNIYPDIEVINDGLQNIDFGAKKYDLIIGNPPYSDEKMTDGFMPDLNGYTIHHYFTAKCMRLLKDDGILAFVLPSFYMDIPRSNTRHIIDGESVVIDVLRLPENLFDQATITVDIIFIRKTGNKIHDITQTTTYNQGEASEQVNAYWLNNPKRIIGKLKLKWVKAYNRYVPTCEVQDKVKTLNYLKCCEFTEATISNYQNIIAKEAETKHLNQDAPQVVSDINQLLTEIVCISNELGQWATQFNNLFQRLDSIKSMLQIN